MIRVKYVFNHIILKGFPVAVLTRSVSVLLFGYMYVCQTTADEENRVHFSL